MTTFAAIDFETATASHDSACAIGVVVVEEGVVVAQDARLIKPPENQYNYFNISIHGITPDQTKTAGTFEEVWPEIADLIGSRLVIAHNAAFDISVLRHSAASRKYSPPNCRFVCSYRIAKSTWPDRWSYRLNALAEDFGIELNHHDALSDANAAAEIILAALTSHSSETIEDMTQKLGYRIGEMKSDDYKPFSNAKKQEWKPGEKLSDITSDTDEYNESHPLFGRSIVFTGTLDSMTRREAQQHAANAGARLMRGTGKSTDYLVVGETDLRKVGSDGMSAKLRKAIELSKSGAPLEIIGEVEFLEMLVEP